MGPGGGNPADTLRDLLFKLPGGASGEMSRDMDSIERLRSGPEQGGKRPENMSPQELHAVLWQVLSFRDSVVKKISKTIEKIPGLGPLVDKIMDSISGTRNFGIGFVMPTDVFFFDSVRVYNSGTVFEAYHEDRYRWLVNRLG